MADVIDDVTVRAHYLHCLEALRVADRMMAEDEANGVDMDGRSAVARGVMQAYRILMEDASPFRNKLKPSELSVVARAQLILAPPPVSTRVM
jgi:hypothetical protein